MNTRRVLLWSAAVAAFAGIGGTLFHFSREAEREAIGAAVAEVSRCIAGGYHESTASLALGMRHREVELVGEWPSLCEESLAQLELEAKDHEDLVDAATVLKKIATTPFTDDHRGVVLGKLSARLRSLWGAATDVGVDVAATGEPAAKRAAPLIDLDALVKTEGLTTRPVIFEPLGSAERDDRQVRYVFKDAETHALVGYCGVPVHGSPTCLRLPVALRHPKTQLVGYTEPGVPPLVYARSEDGKWSVYRAETGQHVFTGYVGGAWSTKDYVAAVTDDEGSEERIVVVEQRGLQAPISRRVIDLADIDPDATRVGDAIIVWEQVIVRTKGDFTGSRFFTIPLPLASGQVAAKKIAEGRVVDFCRAGKETRLATDSPAQCPKQGAPERRVAERAGALWIGAADERTLVLDPLSTGGEIRDASPLLDTQQPGSQLLVLTTESATHVVQIHADDSVTPVGATGPP